MAAEYDAISTHAFNGGGGWQYFNHTTGDFKNRALLFVHKWWHVDTDRTCSTPTYNGVNFADLGQISYNHWFIRLWYMLNPPVGTYQVAYYNNLTCSRYGTVIGVYGVNLEDAIEGYFRYTDYNTPTPWTPSVNVASTPGGIVTDDIYSWGTSAWNAGANQTQVNQHVWDMADNNYDSTHGASYEVATGATTTMSWSATYQRVFHAGISWNPAPEEGIRYLRSRTRSCGQVGLVDQLYRRMRDQVIVRYQRKNCILQPCNLGLSKI